MLFQHISLNLPESLPIFELLVQECDELPQVCVGVHCKNSVEDAIEQLHFNIICHDDTALKQPGRQTEI